MPVLDFYAAGAAPTAAKQLLYSTGTGAASLAFGSGSGTFVSLQTPTFTNSWVNFVGGGPVYENAGYYLDPFGRVWLQGSIKSGTMGASAFTLAAGFRPAKNHQFAVASYNGAANIYGMVEVASTGTVVPTVGANNLISLDGVSFLV
jgi:hypothetical protein